MIDLGVIFVAIVGVLISGAMVWGFVAIGKHVLASDEKQNALKQAAIHLGYAEQAALQQARDQAYWDNLCSRFGPEIAGRILRREYWQGQTEEQLVLSLGPPVEVDESVKRTKTTHVFKYSPNGIGRYRTRITLDDGIVVGWDA